MRDALGELGFYTLAGSHASHGLRRTVESSISSTPAPPMSSCTARLRLSSCRCSTRTGPSGRHASRTRRRTRARLGA